MYGEPESSVFYRRKIISDILNQVYDQQRIAETKHAGLLALNAVLLAGIWQMGFKMSITSPYTDVIIFANIALIISIGISLVSFKPNLKATPVTGNMSNTQPSPIMSYLAASRYCNGKEYLETLSRKLMTERDGEDYDNELASQIVHNSKIALNKFTKFRYAIYLNLLGIVLVIVSLIINAAPV